MYEREEKRIRKYAPRN